MQGSFIKKKKHDRKRAACWETCKNTYRNFCSNVICPHSTKRWTQGEVRQTGRTQTYNREKLIHALQVSAHSGPGRPSGSAGRPLVYAWAASCRQSLPPSGRCSLLAACRPPPPAGKVALLILYLKHRKHRESREQSLNARHSVMHQSWNNVNSICIISAK